METHIAGLEDAELVESSSRHENRVATTGITQDSLEGVGDLFAK
jgi:hypothetical protein